VEQDRKTMLLELTVYVRNYTLLNPVKDRIIWKKVSEFLSKPLRTFCIVCTVTNKDTDSALQISCELLTFDVSDTVVNWCCLTVRFQLKIIIVRRHYLWSARGRRLL